MYASSIINQINLVSDQINKSKIKIILNNLENNISQQLDGSVVEMGCYVGTTSLFIQKLLIHYDQISNFFVYDSFQGLPDKAPEDLSVVGDQFQKFQLSCSKSDLITNFKKNNLPLPRITKAWFNQLTNQELPKKIYFAFLDSDFYFSILDSLKLIWPVFNQKGTIIIDDYNREALPGVSKAVNVFFQHKKVKVKQVENLAIITNN
jgi:O-methyltransferase